MAWPLPHLLRNSRFLRGPFVAFADLVGLSPVFCRKPCCLAASSADSRERRLWTVCQNATSVCVRRFPGLSITLLQVSISYTRHRTQPARVGAVKLPPRAVSGLRPMTTSCAQIAGHLALNMRRSIPCIHRYVAPHGTLVCGTALALREVVHTVVSLRESIRRSFFRTRYLTNERARRTLQEAMRPAQLIRAPS